ncbi:chitinase, partial [Micractinium conductrix]
SWSDPWKGSAATHRLATLPAYVDLVYLSFMYPDATYTGGVTWAGTGIQFSSDPAVVKGAVALLKQRNPRTKPLTPPLPPRSPPLPAASFPPAVPAVRCSIDAEFTRVVTALRSAFPAPRYLLTSAVWSIGAYGQGAWVNSQPQGDHTGQSVNMLSAFGDQLDILNVMSYDAGPTYKPKEALDAYRSLFKGRILMGVEVPPES